MLAITIPDLNNAKSDVDHIAAVATSAAQMATDRLGRSKLTVEGALARITAFNNRGAWAGATVYAVRDVVSESGTWYQCIVAHTSSGSFATDLASKWRVWQGQVDSDVTADDTDDAEAFTTMEDFKNTRVRLATYAKARLSTISALKLEVIGSGIAGDFRPDAADTTSGAWGTGSISGTVFTAAAPTNGTYAVGQALNDNTGATVAYITSLGTGTGGAGTYNLSASLTRSSMTFSADNGGKLLVRVSDGMRLRRAFDDSVKLEWFGTAGDGAADDGAKIFAAVMAVDAGGEWLDWGDKTHRITSAQTFNLTAALKWRAKRARIVADFSADVAVGMQVNLVDGVDHKIMGEGIEFDAGGNCNMGMRFTQPLGTQTASFYAERLSAKNVELQVGAGFGSAGFSVRGGFQQITLIEPRAEDIMIRTGAGVLGSTGCNGIQIINHFPVTGAYAKKILLVSPKVRRVYSEDPDYQYDMDGIAVFANPADDTFGPSHLRIETPDIAGCWGRDVKTQVSYAEIDSPTSLIDEGPTGGLVNPAYDFQTGPGKITGGQYIIDGVAHTAGIVAFQTAANSPPSSSKWDGGLIELKNGGSLARAVTSASIAVSKKFIVRVSRQNGYPIKGGPSPANT